MKIRSVYDWSIQNGLKFNPKKSKSHRSKKSIPQPELYVGQDGIKVVKKVVNLTATDH
jgi:hypothetical protein